MRQTDLAPQRSIPSDHGLFKHPALDFDPTRSHAAREFSHRHLPHETPHQKALLTSAMRQSAKVRRLIGSENGHDLSPNPIKAGQRGDAQDGLPGPLRSVEHEPGGLNQKGKRRHALERNRAPPLASIAKPFPRGNRVEGAVPPAPRIVARPVLEWVPAWQRVPFNGIRPKMRFQRGQKVPDHALGVQTRFANVS